MRTQSKLSFEQFCSQNLSNQSFPSPTDFLLMAHTRHAADKYGGKIRILSDLRINPFLLISSTLIPSPAWGRACANQRADAGKERKWGKKCILPKMAVLHCVGQCGVKSARHYWPQKTLGPDDRENRKKFEPMTAIL